MRMKSTNCQLKYIQIDIISEIASLFIANSIKAWSRNSVFETTDK